MTTIAQPFAACQVPTSPIDNLTARERLEQSPAYCRVMEEMGDEPPVMHTTHTTHTPADPPPCPSCAEALERYGQLPARCRSCGADRTGGVPAEDVTNQGDKQIYYGDTKLHPKRGTASAGTPPPPLRRMEDMLHGWDTARGILWQLLGSPQRAEMVCHALLIQAWRGSLFASAEYLARRSQRMLRYDRRVDGLLDITYSQGGRWLRKNWQRCLARLREMDLVETTRLYRTNGQQSVNLIDLRRLWELLLKLLAAKRLKIERWGWRLWCKLGELWISVDELCGQVAGGPAKIVQEVVGDG